MISTMTKMPSTNVFFLAGWEGGKCGVLVPSFWSVGGNEVIKIMACKLAI